jgi:hypothetical protein
LFVVRELLDKTIAPKQEKLTPAEQNQLIQLLMSKNEELKEVYKVWRSVFVCICVKTARLTSAFYLMFF